MNIIAVAIMYITVIIGTYVPIKMPAMLGLGDIAWWVIILLVYAYIASTLPVQTLLQPRDYINSHKLFINIAYTVIPMIFMVIMTGWAMIMNIQRYYSSSNWLLFLIGLVVFILAVWMVIESIVVIKTVYAKEEGLPDTVT
jgi:carbon starvation protein CstA